MKLHKGDTIIITTGKDKGKSGMIERVYKKMDKVLVLGLNLYKRHIKKSETTPDGGIIELPRPLRVSNVALVCPHCKKTARVGYSLSGNKKLRICKKCEKVI